VTTNLSVAEAKKRFSEIMGRVVYGGERFIIEKRGTPAVAVISLEDLARLEDPRAPRKGIAAIAGGMADFPEFGEIMDAVYRERQLDKGRKIDLDADVPVRYRHA